MSNSVLALPTSVEQIALVIKQMNLLEQQRLLNLVPSLRELASPTVRTVAQAQKTVAHLRTEVLARLNHAPSLDEPFFTNLSLRQYLALSEEQRTQLWDNWATPTLLEFTEREVKIDALSIG